MTDTSATASPDAGMTPAPSISRIAMPWFTITRMQSDQALPPAPAIPHHEASSVIVQLRPFTSHALWRGGRPVFTGGHDEGGVAITDLRDGWRCHHRSPFDNLRVQIGHDELRNAARELGACGEVVLTNPGGAVDPVLLSLARAYLPALAQPPSAHRMYLDHLTNALLTHVLWAYGKADAGGRRKPRLSRRLETLAKEWMSARLFEDVSVDEVAAQCQLSRSHFIKAFKESTGVTPYRWVIAQRIEMAKTLLTGSTSIAQVASQCGFSDQSHFTRMFSHLVGTSPAKWRKTYGENLR